MIDLITYAAAIRWAKKNLHVTDEQIEEYFKKHPITPGATEEQVKQINENTKAIIEDMLGIKVNEENLEFFLKYKNEE